MRAIVSEKTKSKEIKNENENGRFVPIYASKKQVTTIYLTNKVSATLIIPLEMARRHGIDKPTHVTVEETKQGILIRKLNLEDE